MYIIAPMMAMIVMFITPFEFQFQNGAIKNYIWKILSATEYLFQFHIEAIKSVVP